MEHLGQLVQQTKMEVKQSNISESIRMPSLLSKEELDHLEKLNGPKLAEVPSKDVLAMIMKGLMILGIKGQNLPDSVELGLIVNECQTYHGKLTVAQLEDAFTLAVRRKLYGFNPETYQNFSLLYLNGMLSSYAHCADRIGWNIERSYGAEKPKTVTPVYRDITLATSRMEMHKLYAGFCNGFVTDPEYLPYDVVMTAASDGLIKVDDRLFDVVNQAFYSLPEDIQQAFKDGQVALFEYFKKREAKATANPLE